MKGLSDKQSKMLGFIQRFQRERDYPPTIREIQQGCNISSTSVVEYNLRILEREGLIRRDREVSRGIGLEGRRLVRVPIIGHIAAGEPIPVPATDAWTAEQTGFLELTEDFIRCKEAVYALEVKGSSMVDAMILEGDLVLMQHTSTADNGDTVAAWLNDRQEATLKKFFLEKGKVRLQPANDAFKPIYADPRDVRIQGRVVGVIRRLK